MKARVEVIIQDEVGNILSQPAPAWMNGAAITAAQFTIGSSAADERDRFIYNQNTGVLFFDEDGIGAAGQVQIATLSTGLAMTNADIFVV